MSMHMIRGVREPLSKKKKPKAKTASVLAAEKALAETLAKVGYRATKPTGSRRLDLSKTEVVGRQVASVKTSDTIPTNGHKKFENTYTGNEIAGIVTTHKSNLMPIRRDNKTAAIDAATMRRN